MVVVVTQAADAEGNGPMDTPLYEHFAEDGDWESEYRYVTTEAHAGRWIEGED